MRLRELLCETVTKVKPIFYVDFDIGQSLSPTDFDMIRHEVEKLPNCSWCNFDVDSIEAEFVINSQAEGSDQKLGDLFTKVEEIILNALGRLEDTIGNGLYSGGISKILVKNGLPAFPIQAYTIEFLVGENFEFSGIEKLVSNTENLIFKRVSRLDPMPVLSLFKLKNVRNISFQTDFKKSSSTVVTPWRIIRKHLSGDKDILECREELIENGFKEWAKL